MIEITSKIVEGSGTLPKDVAVGSMLHLSSLTLGVAYSWEILVKPPDSFAILWQPISQNTNFGPLDKVGTYLVALYIDKETPSVQCKTFSVSVPGIRSGLPTASDPLFDAGDHVRNFSFELPGFFEGHALFWDVIDDANLLAEHAGTLRGRITPTNFDVSSGRFVMCLGDDLGNDADISEGEIFAVSQSVDLTNVSTLQVELKFLQS